MKRTLIFALLFCAVSLLAYPQSTAPVYTPPVLPPIFSAADLGNSAQLMTDVNNNVAVYTNLLANHDSRIWTLEHASPSAPASPTRATSSGYTMHLQAATPLGCSQAWSILASTKTHDTPYKLVLPGSFYCDYQTVVPSTGSYALSVELQADAVATTPMVVHLELPEISPGVSVASFSYVATTTNATQVSGPSVTLPAGRQIIRLVVDSQGNSASAAAFWIGITQ